MKRLSAIIASLVGIGRDCVKAHLSAAYTRLDASSRSEAVAIAINLGILQGRPLPITPCEGGAISIELRRIRGLMLFLK